MSLSLVSMLDRKINDQEQSIKNETQSASDLVESNTNVVKTESFNEIKIKSEHDWLGPADSEQAGWLEPNLSIVKSEYELQSSFLNWTVDKTEDSDNEDDAEAEEGEDVDGNDFKYNVSDKNLIISETTNPRKILEANRRERYLYFQKKRDFFEAYLLRACPYCGIEFESVMAWDIHLNDMHNYKAYYSWLFTYSDDGKVSCNECKTVLSNNLLVLKTHILIHLPHTNVYKCKLCSYVTSRHLLLLSHIERKHFDVVGEGLSTLMETKSFSCCAYCGKYVGILNMLSKHIQLEHGEICEHKLFYVCPFCGEKFAEVKSHKTHLENVHNFKSLDGLSFKMIEEQENNADQMKYCCLKCNALLTGCSCSSAMVLHALAHLPYKCFKCRFCEYENTFKTNVIKHTCKGLLLDIKNNPMQTVKTATPAHLKIRRSRNLDVINKLHICPKCGESFEQQALWEAHLVKEHNFDKYESLHIETTTSVDGKSEVTLCTICKKKFAKPSSFVIKQHAFTHMPYKIYKCKLCKTSMNSLFVCYCQEKLRKGRFSPITFVCPKCGKEFNKEYNWKKHMINMHNLREPNGLNFNKISDTETPNYKCSECDAVIEESTSTCTDLLFKHATIEHMQFKCYKCSNCGEPSDSKISMIEHFNKCDIKIVSNISIVNKVARKSKSKSKTIPNRKRMLTTGVAVESMVDIKKIRRKICMLEQHCNNPNNQTELERTSENLFASKTKTKTSRKRMLSTGNGDENEEDKKETNKSRPRTSNKKIIKLETQSDPLENVTENVQKLSQTSMAICSPKSFALNKYRNYVTYACPECNIPLATAETWHTHINTEHDFFTESQLNITAIPGVKSKGICNQCSGTVHGSLLHWQRHKLTHMPYQAFICNICIHRTKTLNVLFDHIQRKHLKLGKFKCIFCDVIFPTFYDRFEHIKTQHSNVELENVCKICSIKFEKVKFLQHMIIHDYNQPLYDCGYCDRKYYGMEKRLRHWKRCHNAEFQRAEKESVLAKINPNI